MDVIDQAVQPEAPLEPERYDVVGFSINISNREAAFSQIERIKRDRPSTHVVVGGALCLSDPELFTANPNIDAVFVCEAEDALFEYLTASDRTTVKGVHARIGGEVKFAGQRPWIDDLDSLPFPAFDKVPIGKYNTYPKRALPISSMMTSRGCPYGCIFCSHSMGRKWRARSVKNVVDEIKWQVNGLGVREICIYDDNFSLKRQRAMEICEALAAERLPLRLQFSNGLRADHLDAELVGKLKKAGTWLIGLAPEVGSPEVMRKVKKGFDHAKVFAAREQCRRAGIKTHGFFMIGFPFETMEDLRKTVRVAKDLDTEIVEFNKVIPYPRTELYDMLVAQGELLAHSWKVAKSYHEGTIETHRVGDVPPEAVKALIRQAYRSYYLRPRKMVHLVRTLSVRDLAGLALYAVRTRNI